MDRFGRLSTRVPRCRRTGIATLWLLVSLPALLIVLLIVVDIGNLWIARVELENALEASALAAVKEWGKNPNVVAANWTKIARERGMTLAAANAVRGQSLSIHMNQGTFSATSNPNENQLCDAVQGSSTQGNLIFGKITTMSGVLTFDASDAPAVGVTGQDMFGVRAQASLPVNSLCGTFFGFSGGPYSVSAHATAMYTPMTGAKLVRINQFICLPGHGAN